MLRFFRHGDGRFALFNGANESDGAIVDRVLNRADAKGRAPATAPHSGYERLRAGHSLVLFDCGKPPPAGLDGDYHAGALAFEMSYGRERLIVNCGAYHGPSAEWHAALRATAAHSTADRGRYQLGRVPRRWQRRRGAAGSDGDARRGCRRAMGRGEP